MIASGLYVLISDCPSLYWISMTDLLSAMSSARPNMLLAPAELSLRCLLAEDPPAPSLLSLPAALLSP